MGLRYFDSDKGRVFYAMLSDIKDLIIENDCAKEDELGFQIGNKYSDEVIGKFKEAREIVYRSYEATRLIHLLVSSDISEDIFLKLWEERV